MKKKRAAQSGATVAAAGQDYVVGLVSDSLGAKQTKASTGSLFSLFSTASSNTVTFVPASKVEQKVSSVKTETAQVSSIQKAVKKEETTKEKSAAEKKLLHREEALKNADDDDVKEKPKKVKRVAPKEDYDAETLEDMHPAKRRKIQRNMAEERIKLKRTVFVGNLPVNCQKKDLKRIFKGLGTIESVRFRSVIREDPSMSRRLATIRRQVDPNMKNINAYVVFKEEEEAVNALQMNGMEIEKNLYIRVDRMSKNNSHDHKRSIFVGNLPYDIKELPVRQHFEECGQVEAVRLVRERNSGVGKGFGYVLFENSDAVMLALKLNGSLLLDRKIRVKRSVKKQKEKKKGGPGERNNKGPRGKFKGNFKGSKRAESNKPAGKFFKKGPSNKTSTSFTGEMADPSKKKKGKGLKKQFKPKKKIKTAQI